MQKIYLLNMMKIINLLNKIILIIASASILCGCHSFTPVYDSNNEMNDILQQIEIEADDSLESSELYFQLHKLLGDSKDTKYTLKLKMSNNIGPLLVTKDANVLKQNIIQICHYQLIDKHNGKILNEGKVRVIGSYISADGPYISYTREKYTAKSIINTTAEELRFKLIMFFKYHRGKGE